MFMSKKTNRAYLNKAENGRVYHIMLLKDLYPPYWDEGTRYYPKYRPGYKNSKKQILSFQVRMYKTWKHNRKMQWK